MKKIFTNKILYLILIIIVLSISIFAQVYYSTTQINFNINSVVSYTLTLPGENALYANETGSKSADLELNYTSGILENLNPRVKGGISQSSGTPIFQFDNTGTVNLNLSISVDENVPDCILMKGSTTYLGANSGSNITNSSDIIVTNLFGPNDVPVDWYLKFDVTNCNSSSTTNRTIKTKGVTS